jgi:hypothetical protein
MMSEDELSRLAPSVYVVGDLGASDEGLSDEGLAGPDEGLAIALGKPVDST